MTQPGSVFRLLKSSLLPLLSSLGVLLPAGGWTQAQTASDAASSRVKLPVSITLPASQDSRSVSIRLPKLLGAVAVNDRTLRCVSDAFQIPGQSWTPGLTAGGITLKAGGLTGQTLTPQERATQLKIDRPVLPGQVTLLVIDDFQPVPVRLDEDGLGGRPPVNYQLRHGELVLAHIRSVLQGGGFAVGPDKAVRQDRTILFQKLDIGTLIGEAALKSQGGVSTVQIARALSNLRTYATTSGGGALVVNMSFALIPCNLQSVYLQYRDAALAKNPPLRLTFGLFLKEVADANLPATPSPTAAQEQAYLVGLFTHLPATDPLLTTLRGLLTGRAALAVASSGNYAQSFETMPAAWPPGPLTGPPVLGVGATDSHGGPLAWPDTSDLLEVGEWFHFTSLPSAVGCFVGPGCIFAAAPPGIQPGPASFAYKGTSFSSPTVAAALASRIPVTPGAAGSDPCFTLDPLGFLRFQSGAAPVPKLTQIAFAPLFKTCR
ncbi:hypothetical protein [Deinococcus sp.]|uniref:hypothetical protein n=1 Tax=Deinococcus sp. TaxID=47478 RepID=UPI003C7B6F93